MGTPPIRSVADVPGLLARLTAIESVTSRIHLEGTLSLFAGPTDPAASSAQGDVWIQPAAADTTAPAAVTGFSATAGNTQNVLAWTNPTADFAGVVVVRKAGSYPTSHTDGTAVYTGTGTTYTDTGRTNGVADFYAVYAFDAASNYSTAATATATPTAGNTAPAAFTPTVGTLTASGGTITASTTDPNGDALTYKYQVLPAATAAPAATDASWATAAAFTSPQVWTGGSASTAYIAHVRASDGTLFTVGSSASFTTAAGLATYSNDFAANLTGLVTGGGTWAVVNGKARVTAVTATTFAVHDIGSANMSVKCKPPGGGALYPFIYARFTDANNTLLVQVINNTLQVYTVIAGAYTALGGSATKTVSGFEDVKLVVNGDAWSVWYAAEGTACLSGTGANAVGTGTSGGFGNGGSGASYDFDDLVMSAL